MVVCPCFFHLFTTSLPLATSQLFKNIPFLGGSVARSSQETGAWTYMCACSSIKAPSINHALLISLSLTGLSFLGMLFE